MGNKKSLLNILRVMFSNLTSVFSGVVTGFLLPRLLSMTDYGLYKTFSLYITYMGLCSLGLSDGIVLRYGADDYDALDRPRFRAYFRWLSVILTAFSAGILAAAIPLGGEAGFILAMVGLDLIAGNLTNYFRLLSQITQRFREYSMRTAILSAAKVAIVGVLVVLVVLDVPVDYRLYLAMVVLVDFGLLGWYILTYRDTVLGPGLGLGAVWPEVWSLIRQGFPLMFANFTTIMIMALDRQFVSVLFPTEQYAVYAFAYNMLTLITTAVSAISTVLYPSLKRADSRDAAQRYPMLVSIILLVVFGCMAVYFPLGWVLEWFLPGYVPSIPIFRIIFPGLAASSAVTIVMHNYYKVLGRNLSFFRRSLGVLVLSALANGGAWLMFGSMESISGASVITMLVWYLCAEQLFVRQIGYRRGRNLGYLMVMTAVFYLITGLGRGPVQLALYLLAYGLTAFLFFRRQLGELKERTLI